MVISAAAKAAAKAIKIAKAKRALKPAKTRALKPRERSLKKVSKVRKSKKQGKKTTVHLTTVGKSNTSVAAKKAAAIKQIKNMNVDRNQGIIIGIKGTLPRQPDRVPTWSVSTSPTLPNAKAIKIKKAIEHVKQAKVKKGQNIVVKKGPGEWTPITRRSLTPTESGFYTNYQGKLLPIPGRKKRVLPSIDGAAATRKYFIEQVPGKDDITWHHTKLSKKAAIAQGFLKPSGKSEERIYSYSTRRYPQPEVPRGLWSRPIKKAPRTVAGMDKYAWGAAGTVAGMTAGAYAVGKYDKEIGEHIKGNIKAHVKTGDAAIDVIKERRDQLLRKLGLI